MGVDPTVSVLIGTVVRCYWRTVVTMIFGELYPKNLAIANPEPLARALAVPPAIYLLMFGWLITVFDLAGNALLRVLRIEPLEDVDESATRARPRGAHRGVAARAAPARTDLSMIIDASSTSQRDVEHAMCALQVDSVTPSDRRRGARADGHRHTHYPVIGDGGLPRRRTMSSHRPAA